MKGLDLQIVERSLQFKKPAGTSRGNLMKEMMVAKPKNVARKAREVASVRRRTPPSHVQKKQRQLMKLNKTASSDIV